jgi:hypothetical protein
MGSKNIIVRATFLGYFGDVLDELLVAYGRRIEATKANSYGVRLALGVGGGWGFGISRGRIFYLRTNLLPPA